MIIVLDNETEVDNLKYDSKTIMWKMFFWKKSLIMSNVKNMYHIYCIEL